MKRNIIKAVFALAGGALGAILLPPLWLLLSLGNHWWLSNSVTNFVVGAIIFFIISLFLAGYIERLVSRLEKQISKIPPVRLLYGSLSTVVGLVLAILISTLFYRQQIFFLNTVVPIILMLTLGYLGFRTGTTQADEWRKLFTRRKEPENAKNVLDRKYSDNFHHYKILDTNILIDGRIYDLIKTGFIEGTLLVPNFVLYELQYIADSSDSIKRVRGRRGLDILNKLQSDHVIPVEMYEGDYEEIDEVDSKLIRLAKDKDAVIVTNDYNLNKVSQFQNVQVLNINALANALKPRVIPGENLHVMVVKNGTERQQGVAYLDDGTMVVVEEGKYFINQELDVVVTSALQTDAGRMIFAKPLHSTRGISERNSENS
ncbi:PIN/TRAM domain-containing protein [Pediococcus parvulus]